VSAEGSTSRVEGAGETAGHLIRRYGDELWRVGAGTRWFKTLHESQGFEPKSGFQWLINSCCQVAIGNWFNGSPRDEAGPPRLFGKGVAVARQI
jgi:uncharacterized ferritin-like protein (DUF455 family)